MPDAPAALLQLAPDSTDAGAMERVMLLETRDPSRPDYDRADSLKAMRWMKQVVDNRLAAPKKSRFGEPEDATTETDIISVGNQFAGFGDYPAPPAEARVTNLAAWRTAAATGPGGAFRFVGTLQGNDFYSVSPVPPMPAKRKHVHRK